MATLRPQFGRAVTNTDVNGRKQHRAIAAHTEIQDLLSADVQLQAWGINTRLIGSYSRHTARYPGKDVDVFARLENLDTSEMPRRVYDRFEVILVDEYGLKDQGGRATPQDRSVKVDFPDPEDDDPLNAFAVDAVPAVRDGQRWAIPTKDRLQWEQSTGRWVTTDPVRFGDLTTALNTASTTPTVGSQNAYVPIVRLMRQARHIHLDDLRPGGLYVEFAVYDTWKAGLVTGDEWDPLLAQTLRAVGNRFGTAPSVPLLDPGLGTAVSPPLSAEAWIHAREVFTRLADLADAAVAGERCFAAAKWREILGENERGPVFPLPDGCDAGGFAISSVASVTGIGGTEAHGHA